MSDQRQYTPEQVEAIQHIQDLMLGYGIDKHELAQLSRAEKAALIQEIRERMAQWDIMPWELMGQGRRTLSMEAPRPRPKVRYRHPHTGQEWTGEGPQPQWLKDALLREGMTVDALRV